MKRASTKTKKTTWRRLSTERRWYGRLEIATLLFCNPVLMFDAASYAQTLQNCYSDILAI